MELLLSKKVARIHLNDSSVPIYSFWKSVLNETEAFCRLVSSASLTVEEWQRQKNVIRNPQSHTELEVGFSTFYLNRVNRSGVILGGLIGGVNQDGGWKMDARFTRKDLIQRIEAIGYKKDVIHVTNMDAENYIKNYIPRTPKKTLVYCDPPYYDKSSGLYLDEYIKGDHERISKTIQNKLKRPWILSYDGADKILSYYEQRRYFLYDLQYHAANPYKGKEVFIFCDAINLPESSSLPFIDCELKKFWNKKKRLARNN